MVHPYLQQLIYYHYRPGQCDNKLPSEEWLKTAYAAIGYVATLEDEVLRVSEMNALIEAGFGVEEHKGGPKAVFRGDA